MGKKNVLQFQMNATPRNHTSKFFSGVPVVAQWVNDPACFCGSAGLTPGQAQWVKDQVAAVAQI